MAAETVADDFERRDAAMTIGVDLRCVPRDGSPGSGVAHAARELVEAMCRVAPEDITMQTEERPNRSNIIFVPSGAVSPRFHRPAFPWVHDLDIFDHPEWFPQSRIKRWWTTRLFLRGLRRAPVVFAVSEYTKRQIVRIAGIPSKRVMVTGEGVRGCHPDEGGISLGFHLKQKMTDPIESILILGTVEPRKNIEMIVSIWNEVCDRIGRTIPLIIAGRDGWGNVVIDETVSGVRRERDVSDERADELLRTASLVLVPSLSEGYGRTALEAMARGVPVIASQVGALPEVVGDAGMLLDSNDRIGWIDAIVHLLTDPVEHDRIGRMGRERAKQFLWNDVACLILAEIKKHWYDARREAG